MSKMILAGLGLFTFAMLGAATAQAQDGGYCREYQQKVTIAGTVHNTYGTACMQPDGSWRMVAPADDVAPPLQPVVQQVQQPVVVQDVVYEQPYYVQRQPVLYPSVGLSFGFNDWHGGHGGDWHGGGWHR